MIVICECGEKENISIPESDKRGYVCDNCKLLFDISSDGEMKRSPLQQPLVIETGMRYDGDVGQRIK